MRRPPSDTVLVFLIIALLLVIAYPFNYDEAFMKDMAVQFLGIKSLDSRRSALLASAKWSVLMSRSLRFPDGDRFPHSPPKHRRKYQKKKKKKKKKAVDPMPKKGDPGINSRMRPLV